jgi:hypothetical protein
MSIFCRDLDGVEYLGILRESQNGIVRYAETLRSLRKSSLRQYGQGDICTPEKFDWIFRKAE